MSHLFEHHKFTVEIKGLKIAVIEHTVQDQKVFHLAFADNRKPLVITKAKTWNGEIWTSIPQGRQQEAEKFGNEISKHLKE
ncbi:MULTISPECIES: hypothetical protein [Chryseobacterium]|uniref:Uncharacterized protein n=2 Tax=Chryseobacterium gleum TaxID=250 RepID=A0A3S4R652_CHRGE|nr:MULTISPECIES: hypothetical protein [Chryseobacterium]EFK36038.1 hypothetical protein HMPREF0204_15107 [Chryseobacterium gleum ATCC 35910]QQY31742.1 hypothetical protein I6I60_23330 [Chryseobacterium gleum]VEE11251.1 Uncharacterised protein [Chryseobacterium gleum]VFA44035.1 Uncharacterised protein [Chryseobacterium indologenes]